MMPLNLANVGEETLIRPRWDGHGRIGDRRESDREGQRIPRCHQR